MKTYLPLLILLAAATISCGDDEASASNANTNANTNSAATTPSDPNDEQSKTDEPDQTSANNADEPTEPEPFEPPAPVYPLTETPYTTLQKTWGPAPLDAAARAAVEGELPITAIDRYLEFGIGVVEEPGLPWVEDDTLAPGFAGPTDERVSLTYFWQSADPQLIDEESPIRWEASLIPKGSMYRPQGHLVPQLFESHVRTARRISDLSGRPFDFAFVAGDLTDGGQENELHWSLEILAGGVIDPDSGVDDDPIPGEGNDFADPFYSAGIGVPWYVALGNHETLYMGTFTVTDEIQRHAVADEVFHFAATLPVVGGTANIFNGYRDARDPIAPPVSEGKTPADPRRRILETAEVVQAIYGAGGEPVGHGFAPEDIEAGKGYYSFRPVPDRPIRFIVLNTVIDRLDVANIQGGLDDEQYLWLENELIQAQVADELVFIGSHHRVGAMSPISPVTGNELAKLLANYENVVAHFVGHDHSSGAFLKQPRDNRRGYWELMCPSSVDFPLQSRIVEVVYEGDNVVSIYVTNVDHNATPDSMAHYARHLAAGRKLYWNVDYRDGWDAGRQDDNAIYRVRIPHDVARNLANHEWSARIESEDTLLAFPD